MAVDLTKLLVTVGADVGQFDSEMGRAESTISRFASVGKAALLGAASAMGAAIVGFGVKSVKVAADFETQMNILAVAARASGTSMDDLSAAALAVGADTELVGISASQAADAMTGFYKAGLDTTAIFGDLNAYLHEGASLTGALRAAVDLASASGLELSQTTDIVAVAMATFGLTAEDATGIADSFVRTADASIASVEDLAQGLANVGPIAASFGWTLEDTNTALAILSTRGIKGSDAGTALRSMMANLMRGTEETTAILKSMNVSLYDSEGQMRTLPDIMAQLSTAMAGMSEEQRHNIAQTLAGTHGMRAMNTLIAEGVPGWEAMEEGIANAATAQETAAARTQGLNAATEQLRGVLETLMIKVGTPLIEHFITPAVKGLTEWVAVLSKMMPSTEEVSAALGTMTAAGTRVVDSIRNVIDLIQRGELLAAIQDEWPAWSEKIQAALANAVSSAATWLAANIAPYVAGLWQSFLAWVTGASEKFAGEGDELGTALGERLAGLMSLGINFLVGQAVPKALELWGAWLGILGRLGETFAANAPDLGESYGEILGRVVRFAASALVAAAVGLATTLWNAIKGIWSLTTEEGTEGGPRMTELWGALLEFFQGVFRGFISGLVGDPQWSDKLAAGITKMVDDALEEVKGLPGKFLTFGRSLIEGMIQGIGQMVDPLKDKVGEVLGFLPGLAGNILGSNSPSRVFAEIGADIMKGMELGISRDAHRPVTAVAQATRNITNAPVYNLNATFASAPSSNVEALLRQLLIELRRQGHGGPMPDLMIP